MIDLLRRIFHRSLFFYLTAALLLLAIVFGGASRQNYYQSLVVQLAAAALIPLAVWRAVNEQSFSKAPVAFAILGAILIVPVLQLIPLPPEVWTQLPGRDVPAGVLRAAGLDLPWAPLSMTPDLTVRSGLALIVPTAVFLAVSTFTSSERRAAALVVLSGALLSIGLGGLQMAGGPTSPTYLYETAHAGLPIGFFANRNHQAALLLATMPLAAAMITQARANRDPRTMRAVLAAGLLLAAIAGLGALRSRAGVILVGPAILGILFMILRSGAFGRPRRTALAVGGVVIVALGLVGWFGLGPILQRFTLDLSADLRFAAAPDVWRAAMAHLPLGTGLGSFDSIYRSIERVDLMAYAYLNHAHDDYLEILLETGVVGMAILAAFLLWWGAAVVRAWGARESTLAQAGALATALLLAHSFVEYPMRTIALASVFALACGLLAFNKPAAPRARRVRKVSAHETVA